MLAFRLLPVALLLCFSAFVYAQEDVASARQIVDKFQNELIETMKEGKKMGFNGRFARLEVAVSTSHDLPKIARIVVGKEWEKLTPAQQQQLTDVFSRLSVASYAHNFKDFSGEAFVIESEEETKMGGVVIHSRLNLPDDKPVKFDYMLKENGNSWRIINIIANGVSDLALKRSEYTAILQRDGFEALVAKINEKIDYYAKQ